MANVLGVKTNIGIRLIIALIIIIYGPGKWVKYSGKVLEKFWKIIGKNVWESCKMYEHGSPCVDIHVHTHEVNDITDSTARTGR